MATARRLSRRRRWLPAAFLRLAGRVVGPCERGRWMTVNGTDGWSDCREQSRRLALGIIFRTRIPNPNYPNPNPKYLNLNFPISISVECSEIRIYTRTTRIISSPGQKRKRPSPVTETTLADRSRLQPLQASSPQTQDPAAASRLLGLRRPPCPAQRPCRRRPTADGGLAPLLATGDPATPACGRAPAPSAQRR